MPRMTRLPEEMRTATAAGYFAFVSGWPGRSYCEATTNLHSSGLVPLIIGTRLNSPRAKAESGLWVSTVPSVMGKTMPGSALTRVEAEVARKHRAHWQPHPTFAASFVPAGTSRVPMVSAVANGATNGSK